MRELTKALMSYSLATTVLGLQQVTEVLTSGGDLSESTHVVNNVTAAMVHHMNRPMRTTYQTADAIQRTAVDMLLGGWIPSLDAVRGGMTGGAETASPLAAAGNGGRAPAQDRPAFRASWSWEDSRAPQVAADDDGYQHDGLAV